MGERLPNRSNSGSSLDGHHTSAAYNADEYHRVHGKPLGLVALVVLIFYGVSGGPFGVEEAVQAGGPLLALLGYILFPLAWSIPEALITAELSTAFPEASGFVAWVSAAYGPFWGFMEGYLSWLSGVTDNALYPILFLRYLLTLMGEDSAIGGGYYKWIFVFTATGVLTYLNYRGLEVVGKTAIVVCIMSLLPFALFVIIGAFQVQPARWFILPEGGLQGVHWAKFLNIMFWNLNYWDTAASFAGEVQDPGRTFPRAMIYAIILVVMSSFLPILVGTGASPGSYKLWDAGYFETLAVEVVGPWLGYFMIIAAAISNIGMFEEEMSSDSWRIAGMAERGMLPKVLSQRNRYGTPPYAILLSAVGVVGLGWMSFEQVVELLNLLYCFAQILEFAAFLELRRKFPDLIRPFRIPLGMWGLYAMLFLPILLLIMIISLSNLTSLIFTCIAIVVGAALYGLVEYSKAHKWCEYENQFTDQEHMLMKLAVAQEHIIEDDQAGIAMNQMEEFPESLQHELRLLAGDTDEPEEGQLDNGYVGFVGYAQVPSNDEMQSIEHRHLL